LVFLVFKTLQYPLGARENLFLVNFEGYDLANGEE
jgi:hypothetical protein